MARKSQEPEGRSAAQAAPSPYRARRPARTLSADAIAYQTLLLAFGGVAFIPVTADHGIALVDKPSALRNARPQLPLVFLDLFGLALPALGAPLLVGDGKFLRSAERLRGRY